MTNDALQDVLRDLYSRCLADNPSDSYLAEHSASEFLAARVRAFQWYRRYLPAGGNVLDWGCRHAPDACLVRSSAGEGVKLYGCDFVDQAGFRAFHEFARLEYARLEHPSRLPYADGQFDAVIASGALEHAAWDYECLKELWRCLKPEGVLIVTFLPNRWSYEELLSRRHGRAHLRRYSRGQVRDMLLHCGFVPLEIAYQARSGALSRGGRGVRGHIARALGLAAITSCLCAAGRKVTSL